MGYTGTNCTIGLSWCPDYIKPWRAISPESVGLSPSQSPWWFITWYFYCLIFITHTLCSQNSPGKLRRPLLFQLRTASLEFPASGTSWGQSNQAKPDLSTFKRTLKTDLFNLSELASNWRLWLDSRYCAPYECYVVLILLLLILLAVIFHYHKLGGDPWLHGWRLIVLASDCQPCTKILTNRETTNIGLIAQLVKCRYLKAIGHFR